MRPLLQLLFARVPISHPAVSPRISRWFVFNFLSSSPLTPPSFHSPGKACLKTIMAAVPIATSQSSFRTTGRATCANLKWHQPSFPRPHPVRNRVRQPAGGRVFHQHMTPLFLPCTKSLAAVHPSAPAERRRLLRAPFLESLLPPSVSPEPNLHSRSPHPARVPRDELSRCWFPSGMYLMFACLWNAIFKVCGWMNAKKKKKKIMHRLWEKWASSLIFLMRNFITF